MKRIMDPAPPSWWIVPRDIWPTVLAQRTFPAPPGPVRDVLRWLEERQAAVECASVGVKTVTYR